uniref:NADH-ubiquinone oxidoreductase chain 6 n=2 Tax=Parantica aglea TaxID=396710 RepID=A0A0G2RAC1_9NEOP|nr:NADH dehydrogenase subunit 6 [Parantica aglea]AIT69862.1 NADH dehydrogenase subunit 6 [Parantica aglea]QBZ78052.1 NADH dehydrogenase subunit 6 [Parantica aglea]QNH68960.1 NADH dehydrogenase subunit 6 [Parantica aglea aglea]
MMKMFVSLLIIFFSFIMLLMNHPLSMGLLILIQTLLLCVITGMIINTYWFSYILFLIFLGGLLVLFIYVSSIASNEMFKFMNFNIIIIIIFSILFISIMNNLNLKWLIFFFNDEMMNFFTNFMFSNQENKINLSKLYNNNTFYLMLMMIIYLYITLIAVVKITNIYFGPLRSNF